MTYKEFNKILNKTRRTKEICLTPNQAEEIANKLEVLKILKKVAIQYETIAEIINLGGKDCYTIGDKDKIFFTLDNKDEYEIIKRWLDNDR